MRLSNGHSRVGGSYLLTLDLSAKMTMISRRTSLWLILYESISGPNTFLNLTKYGSLFMSQLYEDKVSARRPYSLCKLPIISRRVR